MDNYVVEDAEGKKLTITGELLIEDEEEHQIEVRTPINTETVQLFKTDDAKYVVYITFQFEGMYPHHHELHEGETPDSILASLDYPTELTKSILSKYIN